MHLFVLVTDYTIRKMISANDQGSVAVTGRAHCQHQVAFFFLSGNSCSESKILVDNLLVVKFPFQG